MPNHRILSVFGTAALLAACGGSQVNSAIPLHPASHVPARPFASGGYQTLYTFEGRRNGASPNGSLIALNGVLYGTTTSGGRRGYGTVFAVDTSGNERVIYAFTGGADGISPTDGLTVFRGVLYGTTIAGGNGCAIGPVGDAGCGTVFAVTTSGKERVVYSFKWGSDGAAPIAGLTVLHGALYGVTWVGGLKTVCANFLSKGCGTAFEVNTSGSERVLHRFKGDKDGALPEGRLLALNGALFGTANKGGKRRGCGGAGCGTIFELNNAGVGQVLYRFEGGADGGNPSAGMISIDGVLYGTTTQGGSVCEDSGCGTIFKATTSGQETTLYRFKGPPDGLYPISSLVAVSGKLYGATFSGGTICIPGSSGHDGGTAFEADTSGAESVIYRFKCHDGWLPAGALLPLGGQLYGATTYGGRRGDGTLYTLSF
jgi:uncharacterized repeat protein (TIGR03803 family)